MSESVLSRSKVLYVIFLSAVLLLSPLITGRASAVEHESTELVFSSVQAQLIHFTGESMGITYDGSEILVNSTSGEHVEGDTNNVNDIFVKNVSTGAIERVSVASDGSEANAFSTHGEITGDGRFVLFRSDATNIIPGVVTKKGGLYVRDRVQQTTVQVNVDESGNFLNINGLRHSISDDGNKVAFATYTSLTTPGQHMTVQIAVRNLSENTTEYVSLNGQGEPDESGASRPVISGDGQHAAFNSRAKNLTDDLVVGDSLNAFYVNLATGDIKMLSKIADDRIGNRSSSYDPVISYDGRYVAFASSSQVLIPGEYHYDQAPGGYVVDTTTDEIKLVSIDPEGYTHQGVHEFNIASISDDGRYLTYRHGLYQLDGQTGFNLNQIEIFVRDLVEGTTEVVSLRHDGTPADSSSNRTVISGDGSVVLFRSNATNIDASGGGAATVNVRRYLAYRDSKPEINLCNGLVPTIVGTEGDDVIIGTDGDDVIMGLGGDDVIKGRKGNDVICGGDGNDVLRGNRGMDTIFGDAGDDYIYGGRAADILHGGDGNDNLFGRRGADILHGDAGDDVLRGNRGMDTLFGGDGNDELFGNRGSDSLDGGADVNSATGGRGEDTCVSAATIVSCEL